MPVEARDLLRLARPGQAEERLLRQRLEPSLFGFFRYWLV